MLHPACCTFLNVASQRAQTVDALARTHLRGKSAGNGMRHSGHSGLRFCTSLRQWKHPLCPALTVAPLRTCSRLGLDIFALDSNQQISIAPSRSERVRPADWQSRTFKPESLEPRAANITRCGRVEPRIQVFTPFECVHAAAAGKSALSQVLFEHRANFRTGAYSICAAASKRRPRAGLRQALIVKTTRISDMRHGPCPNAAVEQALRDA